MLNISVAQAQKIIVLSNKLYPQKATRALEGNLLQAIKHLGYVQLDSISVVARAHHHTLFNRVKNYSEPQLSDLLADKAVFEYWSHAAAILPMDDYRFSLPRKQAFKLGTHHWFKRDEAMMSQVLARIKDQGPLMAKDFKHKSQQDTGWWDWKPAKIALEQLYMQGDLMVAQRQGFHKVYDLTQRVLPAKVNTLLPSHQEYCEHLITQYLRAQGLASANNFGYLLKGMTKAIDCTLNTMLDKGVISKLAVKSMEQEYYALAGVERLLNKRLGQTQIKILSPFDNLVIQRKRIAQLFAFNYQLECYVPQAKRQFGYFSLPIIQGQCFIGTMDTKVDRPQKTMLIKHLFLIAKDIDKVLQPFAQAIAQFMLFNDCSELLIDKITASHQSQKLNSFRQELTSLCRSAKA